VKNMSEKNTVIIFRGAQRARKQVEDFLDSIGVTIIFVKQTDVNRKLVVKNLPKWENEKENEISTFA
jgi:hypothetical protein